MEDKTLEQKANHLKELLESNRNFCIAITGEWGVGKTHFWKNIIEKQLGKKTVYISLFGKEHYREILEEIVLQVCEAQNKIIGKLAKIVNIVSNFAKITTSINVNLDSIFSMLKKSDFDNIIVCLDDIERKSDKLKMRDLMGLMVHLRDIKECDVVIMLNDEKLNDNKKPEKTQGDDKNKQNEDIDEFEIYEKYKEKCIDYIITIQKSYQASKEIVARAIQDSRLIELIPHEICLLGNLRSLKKILDAIKYFNERLNIAKKYSDEKYNDVIEKLYGTIYRESSYCTSKLFSTGKKPTIADALTSINNYIKEYWNDNILTEDSIKLIHNEFDRFEYYTNITSFENLLRRKYYEDGYSYDKFAEEAHDLLKKIDEKDSNNMGMQLDYLKLLATINEYFDSEKYGNVEKKNRKRIMKILANSYARDTEPYSDTKLYKILTNNNEQLRDELEGMIEDERHRVYNINQQANIPRKIKDIVEDLRPVFLEDLVSGFCDAVNASEVCEIVECLNKYKPLYGLLKEKNIDENKHGNIAKALKIFEEQRQVSKNN